jgi:hypothetical protein
MVIVLSAWTTSFEVGEGERSPDEPDDRTASAVRIARSGRGPMRADCKWRPSGRAAYDEPRRDAAAGGEGGRSGPVESIGLPVYNGERYLEGPQSILGQSFGDFGS